MPQAVTGNADRHPQAVLGSLIEALAAAELVTDETGRTGPVQTITDSGIASGGEGGGNQPLVRTVYRHGLTPGEIVTLTGCGVYNGSRQVEPSDDWSFLLDDTPFTAETVGGSWS